jgi:hypothetical protein
MYYLILAVRVLVLLYFCSSGLSSSYLLLISFLLRIVSHMISSDLGDPSKSFFTDMVAVESYPSITYTI